MSGIIKNLFSKFLKFEENELEPSFKPLEFSNIAIERINKQIQSRSKGINSGFKISVEYKPDRAFTKVGFAEYLKSPLVFQYPIPIMISEKDELYLRGHYIDYFVKEDAFFIFPNIEMNAVNTLKKNIVRFNLNRYVIHPNSIENEFVFGNGMEMENLPPFIKSISKTKGFSSLYAKGNSIQIEFLPDSFSLENEEKIAKIIYDHFEQKGYPLTIQNSIATEVY